MKINKGYSLSQFVDYLFADDGECKPQIKDSYIRDYNNFLKQPLTKDMFINEVEKPTESLLNGGFTDGALYTKRLNKWQEAENKVIFECDVSTDEDCFVFTIGDIEIWTSLQDGGDWFFESDILGEMQLTTLHDLFEATKGELKLKNVTI